MGGRQLPLEISQFTSSFSVFLLLVFHFTFCLFCKENGIVWHLYFIFKKSGSLLRFSIQFSTIQHQRTWYLEELEAKLLIMSNYVLCHCHTYYKHDDTINEKKT